MVPQEFELPAQVAPPGTVELGKAARDRDRHGTLPELRWRVEIIAAILAALDVQRILEHETSTTDHYPAPSLTIR